MAAGGWLVDGECAGGGLAGVGEVVARWWEVGRWCGRWWVGGAGVGEGWWVVDRWCQYEYLLVVTYLCQVSVCQFSH